MFVNCMFSWLILVWFLLPFQFEIDYVVESTLSISDELLNTKYKDKLEPSYKVLLTDFASESSWNICAILIWVFWLFIFNDFQCWFCMTQGLIHDVFTNVLRALSSAKVTRPGKFRSCQDGYAVKSSLKAEDGILYPLEKSFFFLPKPPTLILHEEVYFSI